MPRRLRRATRRISATTAVATVAASLGVVALATAAPAAARPLTPGNVAVVRIGSGSGALAVSAAPVFIDEYSPTGGLVQSIPLPTAPGDSGRALTMSGTVTSEGALAVSRDGRYLTLAGYDAAPGSATGPSTSATAVNRVLGRISTDDGAVDTSTALSDAHGAGNIRGAVTDDGGRYWTVGSNQGVRLAAHGATTSTSISTTQANLRVPVIADGKLFVSSTNGTHIGVNQVGTGLPSASGAVTSLLPGLLGVGSPHGFAFLDRSEAVPGVDTLYMAEDSGGNSGITKYSFSGTRWSQAGSARPDGQAVRGLSAALGADGSARLVVTTTGSPAKTLIVRDAAEHSGTLALSEVTTVATAGANTTFRGVAFVPGRPPVVTTQPADVTVKYGARATLTVTASGSRPLTYQWYRGAAGDTSTPVGDDSASFTTPALEETTRYWVRVRNAVGAVDSATVTVTVDPLCARPTTTIPEIQGSGPEAAVTGEVTVRGVVVADHEGPSPALRGFYLQDPSGDGDTATSDGIFVFNSSRDDVGNGDLVEVTGTAGEFHGQTQISADSVTACPAQAPAVDPVDVTLPLASPTDLERHEGMLVRVDGTLSVTEHFQLGRFGQVVVSAGGRLQQPTNVYDPGDERAAELAAANRRNRLIIDDASQAQNPPTIPFARGGEPLTAANTLRAGDTVTRPVGVMTYTWGGHDASPNAYRLRPIGALGGSAEFVAANARPAGPPAVGGSLKVASANLLNYFDTFSGCTLGVGGESTDCRGAEDAEEFERQAAKEVAALTALDADVVAVMEVENDGYGPGSAIADLVERLDAATAPGTWAFVDPDAELGAVNVAGTDAIKVGLLYRAQKVTPVPGTTAVDTADVHERRPLAQAFQTADGGRVSVVAAHLKSKSCGGAAGEDADAGDGQGCYTARRVSQATALASFVSETVVPAADDPDVLVTGDLNSYAKEDPVEVLAEAGFVDLVDEFAGDGAYSYGFDGQWGYLDHALASTSLRGQVSGAGEYHINADEPSVLDYNTDFKTPEQVSTLYAPDRFRSSDHDPVLVGLDLAVRAGFSGDPQPATAGAPYSFEFTPSGTPPVTFSVVDGTLPSGLSLSESGRLSGTPTTAGTAAVKVRASGPGGSTERTVTITVNKAASTTVVASSNNPSSIGQSVSWTATVTASTPGVRPTGTVRFYISGVSIGSAQLVNGTARSGTVELLWPGTYTVEARYSGDDAVTSGSGVLSQRVRWPS